MPFGRAVKQRVREAWSSTWKMTYRNGRLYPPQRFPPEEKEENPLCVLGECGLPDCLMTRTIKGKENVRVTLPGVLAGEIQAFLPHFFDREATEGLIYCTLGCGTLYFDWELLEELLRRGIKLKSIWLVDLAFDREKTLEREKKPEVAEAQWTATNAFARWFADVEGLEVHAFSTLVQQQEWIAAFPEVGKAHILMQCDTPIILDGPAVEGTLVKDGLHVEALVSNYSTEVFSRSLDHDGLGGYEMQDALECAYVLRDLSFTPLKSVLYVDNKWVETPGLVKLAQKPDLKDFEQTPKPLDPELRELTRKAWQDGWSLVRREGRMRPPFLLKEQPRIYNPLAGLGECAEEACPFSRSSLTTFPASQPTALEFLVDAVLDQFPEDAAPATYLSLGSGSLYLDWELLESLINLEQVKIKSIWLVDWCYHPDDPESGICAAARSDFANWFSDVPGLQIVFFPDAESLQKWVKAHPEAGKADIVNRYDALNAQALLLDPSFRQDVVAEGALYLEAFEKEQASDSATDLLASLEEDPGESSLFAFPVLRSSLLEGGDLVKVRELVGRPGQDEWVEA